MNAALILSGGVGERYGADRPKQYTDILGRMAIEYVIDAAKAAKKINTVMVAGYDRPELDDLTKRYGLVRAAGGEKRNLTLKNGLDALSRLSCDKVVILDAVRPLVTGELIDRYIDLLDEYDAVSTVHSIDDSLGCLDLHTVDRSRYYLMQSPEGYRFRELYEKFDPDSALTEVAQQLDESAKLCLYRDFPDNPKLTYPRDLKYITLALKERGI